MRWCLLVGVCVCASVYLVDKCNDNINSNTLPSLSLTLDLVTFSLANHNCSNKFAFEFQAGCCGYRHQH